MYFCLLLIKQQPPLPAIADALKCLEYSAQIQLALCKAELAIDEIKPQLALYWYRKAGDEPWFWKPSRQAQTYERNYGKTAISKKDEATDDHPNIPPEFEKNSRPLSVILTTNSQHVMGLTEEEVTQLDLCLVLESKREQRTNTK
jgi:hypothetical protein